MDNTVFQIIDVNLNRSIEGLRVIEEIARFVTRNERLTKEIKTQRHKLARLFADIPLLNYRDTSKDLGKYGNFDNSSYKDLHEITKRNLKRVQEGCRTIEEFNKLPAPQLDKNISKTVKEIRFKIYDIEKEILSQLPENRKSKLLHSQKSQNRGLKQGQGTLPTLVRRMPKFSLYVILDEKYITPDLSTLVKNLCEGGAEVIQLREKQKNSKNFLSDAIRVRRVIQDFKTLFIVNDRPDIALLSHADGLHIGESDIPVKEARKILPNHIIGASVNSAQKAIQAREQGANYVAVGCLFPSNTKDKPLVPLSLVADIKKAVHIPVLGIGGITIDKIDTVLNAGADGVCIAGDIFNHPNIKKRTKTIRAKLDTLISQSK